MTAQVPESPHRLSTSLSHGAHVCPHPHPHLRRLRLRHPHRHRDSGIPEVPFPPPQSPPSFRYALLYASLFDWFRQYPVGSRVDVFILILSKSISGAAYDEQGASELANAGSDLDSSHEGHLTMSRQRSSTIVASKTREKLRKFRSLVQKDDVDGYSILQQVKRIGYLFERNLTILCSFYSMPQSPEHTSHHHSREFIIVHHENVQWDCIIRP